MSAVPDTDKWLLPLVAAGICAAVMAVLVAGIALALGTTGHDWYAAWRLTMVEAMLGVGFDDYAYVEYRTADGETISVERYRYAYVMPEAWLARRRIFSLAADRALLGACAGLALFGIWLVARMALRLRQLESGRGTVVEPAPRIRPGYAGRMRQPDDWSDGELIATLARRSGRLGVLLVSTDEVGRLAGAGDATRPPATLRDSLPPARTPGLPPPERARPAGQAAVSAKPAPTDPGSCQDTAKADQPAEDKPVVPERELGEQFF